MIRDMEIIKKCNYTSPVAKDVLNSALINKILLDANNYAFKCFLHCLYREYGWVSFQRCRFRNFARRELVLHARGKTICTTVIILGPSRRKADGEKRD
ncbi:Hypothetical predicted protein [Cloeon dipterum]|nr:Hypothetical predicted protein [Cloeon dipterum]